MMRTLLEERASESVSRREIGRSSILIEQVDRFGASERQGWIGGGHAKGFIAAGQRRYDRSECNHPSPGSGGFLLFLRFFPPSSLFWGRGCCCGKMAGELPFGKTKDLWDSGEFGG